MPSYQSRHASTWSINVHSHDQECKDEILQNMFSSSSLWKLKLNYDISIGIKFQTHAQFQSSNKCWHVFACDNKASLNGSVCFFPIETKEICLNWNWTRVGKVEDTGTTILSSSHAIIKPITDISHWSAFLHDVLPGTCTAFNITAWRRGTWASHVSLWCRSTHTSWLNTLSK
jgi:hypothetical protein